MYSIAKTYIISIIPESVYSFSSSTLQKLCLPTLAFTMSSDPAKFITPSSSPHSKGENIGDHIMIFNYCDYTKL
jgi:hypothetical protein